MIIKLFFLVFLFTFSNFSSANSNKIAVKIATAQEMEFYKQVSLPAECLSFESKDYFASIDGIIDIIPSNKKNQFKKGELILAIDKSLLDTKKHSAEAEFKAAQSAFNRDKVLLEKNIITQAQFEKTKTTFYSSKAHLAESTKAYENSVIYAPFNGIISTIKYKTGELIKAGEFLFNITGDAQKLLRFEVPQLYKIKPNEAKGIVNYNNKTYPLADISISNNLTNNFGSYNATAKVTAPNELEHNSYVLVNLTYDHHIQVGIPEKAVIKAEGASKVFVVEKDDKVKIYTVKLGDRIGQMIEIISGDILKGTKIVTDGIQKLNDGDLIETVN